MYSSIPSCYDLGSCSKSVNFLQGVRSSTTATTNMGSSIVSSISSSPEEKAAAASRSHSEAERRRRKRINNHLATLRSLLPNTIKTDKASLLAEVVRRLRELKKTTSEFSAGGSRQSSDLAAKEYSAFPSEEDELQLCYCEGDSGTVKATLCCEDRLELMSDMTRAVRSVEGKVVRAEMTTVGGRTKTVLWMKVSGGDEGIATLRRGLKVVLDRAALSTGSGQALPGSKRPRLSQY